MKTRASYATALTLLALAGVAQADARSDYYQRATARDTEAFKALDINHDGVVDQREVAGDNDFGSRFRAMDRNGDGVVTRAELALYIEKHYGIDKPAAAHASMVTQHIADATSQPKG